MITLDKNKKGTNATISEDGLSVVLKNASDNFVISTVGKKKGKLYAEIDIQGGTAGLVGVCTDNINIHSDYGQKGNWVYYSNDGALFEQGVRKPYGKSWGAGDNISIALDLDSPNRTLRFYKNGIANDTIENLPEEDIYIVLGYASSYLNLKATVNFGATPFKYPIPEGYIAFDNDISDNPCMSIIPKMDKNIMDNGTECTGSSYYSDNYNFYKAFDKVIGNVKTSWQSNGGGFPQWIKVKIRVPQVAKKYSLSATNDSSVYLTQMASEWTFQGSNDGENWVDLDTQTNQTNWSAGETRYYDIINNKKQFNHYRIYVTNNNGYEGYVLIGEIDIFTDKLINELVPQNMEGEKVYPTNINGEGFYLSNANGLFDNSLEVENPMNHSYYWCGSLDKNTYYVQFTIDCKVNIWRTPHPSYLAENLQQNCLKILKLNNETWEDVTNKYPQTVTVLKENEWEKTISNLPKGTYRFICNGNESNKVRIDGEWCLEKVIDKIGTVLNEPEKGWKRIDDTDLNLKFKGAWDTPTDYSCYNKTCHLCRGTDYASYGFSFKGSKFRIISTVNYNHPNNVEIYVDDVKYTYSESYPNLNGSVLVFELTDLPFGEHKVKAINNTGIMYFSLDAIDIDEDGEILVSPTEIGEVLNEPEKGWKRIGFLNENIKYMGTGWGNNSNNDYITSNLENAKIKLKVKNTKRIRIIAYSYFNRCSQIININNGEIKETYINNSKNQLATLIYENENLNSDINIIEITPAGKTGYMSFTAIDIDEGGEILAFPIQIGDKLDKPQEGWKRIDAFDGKITYVGNWSTLNGEWTNSIHPEQAKIKFNIKNSKRIRIIAQTNGKKCSNIININDKIQEHYNCNIIDGMNTIVYEFDNLNTKNYIEITRGENTGNFAITAIDIDESGELIKYRDLKIGEPSWIDGYDVMLFVDSKNGIEDALGTREKPFKSLKDLNDKYFFGENTFICLNDGEYEFDKRIFTNTTNETVMIIGNNEKTKIIQKEDWFCNYGGGSPNFILNISNLIFSIPEIKVVNYNYTNFGLNFYNVVFDDFPKTIGGYGVFLTKKYINFYNCVKTSETDAFLRCDCGGVISLYNCYGAFTSGYVTIQQNWDRKDNIINMKPKYDDDFKLLDVANELHGVYSGDNKWLDQKFLLEQGNRYYTVNPEKIENALEKMYSECAKDFDENGFKLDDLTKKYDSIMIEATRKELNDLIIFEAPLNNKIDKIEVM